MGKIKKIKGGFYPTISEDEKLIATTSTRNTVYIHDLETGKLRLRFKTLSNVARTAFSPDLKTIAVKNTGGLMAVASMETGEQLSFSKMEQREGYQMHFLPDGKHILDLDWSGRTMVLDIESNEHKVLESGSPDGKCPRVAYMHLDPYSKQIYKFVADTYGNSKGVVMVSPADIDKVHYEIIREFPELLPDHLKGISFCKEHIYHVDKESKEIIVSDKLYTELRRIALPDLLKQPHYFPKTTKVSPCEKYVFFNVGRPCDPFNMAAYREATPLALVYRLDTMEKVLEFDYDFVSDFTMINDDTTYILATWEGSYIGKIEI